jgi:molybdopterin converting factor small subunit
MRIESVPAIQVRVLLFGSYAEWLRMEALEVTVPVPATVEQVVAHLRGLPGGEQLPTRPLVALNLMHVGADTRVSPGDEIAILPPLAGG